MSARVQYVSRRRVRYVSCRTVPVPPDAILESVTESTQPDASGEGTANALVLGQGPNGEMYVLATPNTDEDGDEPITEPAKVMRIGRMISRLLDEVKDAPLDDASRARLREIYAQSIDELAGGLDEDLAQELRRITTPFDAGTTPSDAELRIAQAQLVGWLEGLFQGLQTALVAQHISAKMNEQGGYPVIPPGRHASAEQPGMSTGMYL